MDKDLKNKQPDKDSDTQKSQQNVEELYQRIFKQNIALLSQQEEIAKLRKQLADSQVAEVNQEIPTVSPPELEDQVERKPPARKFTLADFQQPDKTKAKYQPTRETDISLEARLKKIEDRVPDLNCIESARDMFFKDYRAKKVASRALEDKRKSYTATQKCATIYLQTKFAIDILQKSKNRYCYGHIKYLQDGLEKTVEYLNANRPKGYVAQVSIKIDTYRPWVNKYFDAILTDVGSKYNFTIVSSQFQNEPSS